MYYWQVNLAAPVPCTLLHHCLPRGATLQLRFGNVSESAWAANRTAAMPRPAKVMGQHTNIYTRTVCVTVFLLAMRPTCDICATTDLCNIFPYFMNHNLPATGKKPLTIKHKSFVWVCKKENKLRGKRGAREREIERDRWRGRSRGGNH